MAVGSRLEWVQLTEYIRTIRQRTLWKILAGTGTWTMSFAEANEQSHQASTLRIQCFITSCILSPWRWSSGLCSKQVLVGFLHLFRILMESGTMQDDVVLSVLSRRQQRKLSDNSHNQKFSTIWLNECCAIQNMNVDGISLGELFSFRPTYLYIRIINTWSLLPKAH